MKSQTRTLLLIGFGGLLVLLAVVGLEALSALRKIETRNETIRQDYVRRNRSLEQLRSDVYLSGTYIRDLLFEPDSALESVHRKEFEAARGRIAAGVAEYGRIVRPEEQAAFQHFTNELNFYLGSLQPALDWNASERRSLGYEFMQNSLLPRRTDIVRLADQIGEVSQTQMQAGSRQVAELFSAFRRSLLALLILAFVIGLSLAGLSIVRILRLETEKTAHFGQAVQARSALRDLSSRLVEAQESERRALSRELHDEVGQSLSALLLGIANLAATISPEARPAEYMQLQGIRKLTERTCAVVRDISLLLRPSMLDDLGLVPALEWQAREINRTSDVSVEVHAGFIPDDMPDEAKTSIYRIVQEALRNVTRHAGASRASVHLAMFGEALRLTIEDDGRGFSPERQRGMGLLGIEERILRLNGSIQIESRQGEGTSLRIELPMAGQVSAGRA